MVLGGVSPDGGGQPDPELLMMVLVGGKGRSLAEFRELAREAGLEVQATGRQPSGRFVVECRPICSGDGPADAQSQRGDRPHGRRSRG